MKLTALIIFFVLFPFGVTLYRGFYNYDFVKIEMDCNNVDEKVINLKLKHFN